jgi:acyl-CoA thioesterase
MTFDQLINNPALADNRNLLSFPADWCQGRTAFGGLSAAFMLKSMFNRLSDDRRLLSLSTNFVGPLLSDEPFQINTQVLRSGKNATQMLSTLTQGDNVCLIAQGCFAKDRDSSIHVPSADKCTLGPVQEAHILPYQEGVMPAFFQHVALNAQQGALPFSGAKSSNLGGWMRLKAQPEHQLNALHLLALADAWPPTLLQMCSAPSPASSMSWYIEFLSDIDLPADAWLGFEAVTHHSAKGYGVEDANIYGPDRQLLALSRQTVAIFDC